MSTLNSTAYHRVVARVSRWCTWYTRGLDADLAGAHRDEIASDLYEQAAWADEVGLSPRKLSHTILNRSIRGALADLTWRQAQIRREALADPADLHLRRTNGAATTLVMFVAIGLLAWGVYVIGRVAISVILGDIRAGSETLLALLVFSALAACGVLLLARPTTRIIGALWMALPSFGLVHFGLYQLFSISTTVGVLLNNMRNWDLANAGLIAGLCIFFVSAALWWWVDRRPHSVVALTQANEPGERDQ